MVNLRCIIVDDEPFARKGLEKYVAKTPFLALLGMAGSVAKAKRLLESDKVDLIYLDINLPKTSGIDFLKSLESPPQVIFTTAYPGYAIEGYALDVTDYLLKPITYERFLKASEKALNRLGGNNKEKISVEINLDNDYFFIKTKGKLEKIKKDDILYLKGMGNYVVIFTNSKKYVTYASLKDVGNKLDSLQLITIHKSYRVPLKKIESMDTKSVTLEGNTLPVSRNYKEQVLNVLERFKII